MLPGGPFPTDRESLESVCEVEFYRGSGPGGQNRNKRETGVRITHRPSGLVATATERRSQLDNLEMAYARLAARIDEAQRVRRPRKPTRPSRSSVERRLEAKRRTGQKKSGRSELDS